MTDKPIEVEAVPTQAIAVRQNMPVGQAMSVEDIVAQVTLIQTVMARVMKEGEHYGAIPGCGEKKTLLQPGAQKLTMTFRLAPTYDIQEVNLDRGHKEYRVVCTLKSIQSGAFVGQGVGCCSSMESKYRWRKSQRTCPKCGQQTIVAGKPEYGGGWLCWKKKGGCGEKFAGNDQAITSQPTGDVENPNPADTFNTVLKIAKKRAFVDATITATAASDIFTQDIGDAESDATTEAPEMPQDDPEHENHTNKPPPNKKPATTAQQAPHPAVATDKTRQWMIENLNALEGSDDRRIVTEFFDKAGVLLSTEAIEDMPLTWVPVNKVELQRLKAAIHAFANGEQAHMPYEQHDGPAAGAI